MQGCMGSASMISMKTIFSFLHLVGKCNHGDPYISSPGWTSKSKTADEHFPFLSLLWPLALTFNLDVLICAWLVQSQHPISHLSLLEDSHPLFVLWLACLSRHCCSLQTILCRRTLEVHLLCYTLRMPTSISLDSRSYQRQGELCEWSHLQGRRGY